MFTMGRPFKRPRLSLFDQSSSGAELDQARRDNDMTLKGRLESIFAKYSQDFTGIGDEIEVLTGRVVVNNGHLESMETETDPGIDHLSHDFASTGRSMIRAMTNDLNPNFPGPDDVLTSIEMIAENAGLSHSLSSDDDEDKLSRKTLQGTGSRTQSHIASTERDLFDHSIAPYDSDCDSLFDVRPDRDDSPDSLFADTSTEEVCVPDETLHFSPDFSPDFVQYTNKDEDIIARFGPCIGREVIDIIDQRKDAHIEPAWRIPVQIQPSNIRNLTAYIPSSSPCDRSPVSEDSFDVRQNKSLWELPKPRTKRRKGKSSSLHEDREESIDPLQEDFEAGTVMENSSAEDETDTEYNSTSVPEDEITRKILTDIAETAECPYCYGNYTTKSGVMAHWDRLLRQDRKEIRDDDPHDIKLILKIRSAALIRKRFLQLVVHDFRTMVELHEGAGLSFDEIVETTALRTHNAGFQLEELYNNYRSPSSDPETGGQNSNWTDEEEKALLELCRSPLVTMAALCRELKGRDEAQIGNHLAELWLNQLRGVENQATAHANASRDDTSIYTPRSMTKERMGSLLTDTPRIISDIRSGEQSEDELYL